MIVAIHQPQFMPWIGYFDKMDRADVFVYLDNVQFRKNEFQNRNKIKTSQGWQWLTVPVSYNFPASIDEVKIQNNANWKRKHLRSIQTNYQKALYFDKYYQEIVELYAKDYEFLFELNIDSVEVISKLLGINKKKYRASEIKGLRKDPTLRLVDICTAFNADTYLSGKGGENYLDVSAFNKEGIDVVFQDFHCPTYRQFDGDFLHFMSSIDLLFNCGGESLKILRGGEKDEYIVNWSTS